MNCQRQQPFDELSSKSDVQDIVFNLDGSFYVSEISTFMSEMLSSLSILFPFLSL
jgi:hypothetical protein